MQEIKKTRIVLASVLKPVDDTRMYEKFGFETISYEQMPRYFQRMKKVFDIADVFMRTGEDLLVMKLK